MRSQAEPPRPESAVAHEQHEAASWFQQCAVIDDVDVEADKDLFSEIFGERAAAPGLDTAGYSTLPPPRGGKAGNALPGHDASTKVKKPGKRKRSDTSESTSEVMLRVEEPESAAATTPGKRRRAAQEHNLSERRRRDRINEKMRALQQLVPHCNKTDKASMLDEAIEYLKSLQLQVQVMWTMGGGMAPVMFPASGAHQYMQRCSRMPPFRT